MEDDSHRVRHFRDRPLAPEPVIGLIGLAAMLTRLDAGLAVAASVCVSVWDAVRRRQGLPVAVAALARRWWPIVVGAGAFFGWKLWYYGTILPNTYYAKAADQWQVVPGAYYVAKFLVNSPQVAVMATAALAGLALHRQYSRRSWLLFLTSLSLAWAAYVVKVGGDFIYYRLMFEIYPVIVLAAVPGFLLGLQRRPAVTLCVLAAVGGPGSP